MVYKRFFLLIIAASATTIAVDSNSGGNELFYLEEQGYTTDDDNHSDSISSVTSSIPFGGTRIHELLNGPVSTQSELDDILNEFILNKYDEFESCKNEN